MEEVIPSELGAVVTMMKQGYCIMHHTAGILMRYVIWIKGCIKAKKLYSLCKISMGIIELGASCAQLQCYANTLSILTAQN